jgi:phosphate transport system substrate-binding protein
MSTHAKRPFAFLLLAVLITAILAACGQQPSTPPTAEPAPAATEAPAPTEAPAEEPTEAPAEEPTEAPAEEPTEAPAEEPTEAPAEEPTEAPAEEPTEAPAEPSEPGGEGVTLPDVDPADLDGNIITAGSSTVGPLTIRMVERFQDEGFEGDISVDIIGSGAGLERFCVAGETDIANASRAIREEEIESCNEIGRDPIEFRVGTDALAVVVSEESPVEDLTLEQLVQIFSGEITTWDELDPSFPAEEIRLYSPGTDSGTYDFFIEEVLDEDETGIQSAPNIQFSENDNVLVQGVEGSPYAIGYFGYAYYAADSGRLRAVTIDGVEPSEQTTEDGSYSLARPLFIYSDAAIMQEKPQVADFINFYLTFVNEEVIDVGYFPASQQALDTAKNSWLETMGMASQGGGEAAGSGEEIALPDVDPAASDGNIITAGSSTVGPLTIRMVERFQDEGFEGDISVDIIGSGAGLERFCVAGETDIANASRAIREEEIESCNEIGRDPIEFRVGTDALAVVVSEESPVEDLTLEQLVQIFSGEITTWDELDPSFPAEEIRLYSPGTDSGTYDFFIEEVLDEDETGIQSAPNIQFSENDNVLVQGVEGSPYAIGYFGYAYYAADSGRLRAVTIDGVEPSEQTTEDGSYSLARPLFIYSDAAIMQEKPQVADFINFYLTFVNEEVIDVGYFPASQQALNTAKQNWLDAVGE